MFWCLPVCLDIPVLSLFPTEIDSASLVSTLKSFFKDIHFLFFHCRDINIVGCKSRKQGEIGLMTARESREGISSSALQGPQ